ncbi:hypothetical protein [Demequina aurantiaca]|uniref:hypothetical protein n=1 Tax=Demequina aurantiaca TaxID=676200 RepID=UPI003D3515C8
MREIDGSEGYDFTVDIWCNHYTKPDLEAPQRLISVAFHKPRPNGAIGFLEWRAATVDGKPSAMTTYWDAIRAMTTDMPTERRAQIMRSPAEQDKLLSRGRGNTMSTNRWDFYCEDCADALPVRYEKMTPILERLMALEGSNAQKIEQDGLTMQGMRVILEM